MPALIRLIVRLVGLSVPVSHHQYTPVRQRSQIVEKSFGFGLLTFIRYPVSICLESVELAWQGLARDFLRNRSRILPAVAVLVLLLALAGLILPSTPLWPGHCATTNSSVVAGLFFWAMIGKRELKETLRSAGPILMDDWNAPLMIIDRQDRLISFNSQAIDKWKLSSELFGSTIEDLAEQFPSLSRLHSVLENHTATIPESEAAQFNTLFARPLANGNRRLGTLVFFSNAGALETGLEEKNVALEAAFVRLSEELSARRSTEKQLLYFALHDPLTGLANRSYFLSRVELAIDRSKRNPTNRFGLVGFRVLGLGRFNQHYGIAGGDKLLVEISSRMKRILRNTDSAARATSNSFMILLDEISSVVQLKIAADRIRKTIEVDNIGSGVGDLPSFCFGMILCTSDVVSPEAAMNDIEFALAKAERDKSRSVVLFDPSLRQTEVEKASLKDDLGLALGQGKLHLIYQPIVDLGSGNLAGFEALCRWNHPSLGAVPPSSFIATAERERLISPLGLWVARQASRGLVHLQRQGGLHEHAFVAINVSPLQLRDPRFPSVLLRLIDREEIDPCCLHLEITESALVACDERLLGVLKDLRQEGLKIKLDDFGTGYSSLHLLHRLPVDTLKIDQSFVSRLPESGPIIQTILGLAKNLGLDVVAEGIEYEAQRTLLTDLACESGQGYLFGKGWSERELVAELSCNGPLSYTHLDPI